MSDTPYNTDLMIQVRDHIRANPEQHDQKTWGFRNECGTTHCIAGWAAALAGEELKWIPFLGRRSTDFVRLPGGAEMHISNRAADLLGLDEDERHALFANFDNAEALALLDRMIEAGKNGERVGLGGP